MALGKVKGRWMTEKLVVIVAVMMLTMTGSEQ